MLRASKGTTYRPDLESLEDRFVLAVDFHYLPVVPYIDATMQNNLRHVYEFGQALGQRNNVFMKVGDSNSWFPIFLHGLGAASFNALDPNDVGPYTNLATTINFFRDAVIDPYGANSFNHESVATMGSWKSAALLTPGTRGVTLPWLPGLDSLSPLDTEIVQSRPAFALVMIGTVDVSSTDPTVYQSNLIAILQDLIGHGVIPIVSTIPEILQPFPNIEYETALYNQIIANVAQSLSIPLWNLYMGLDSLNHQGLSGDDLHLASSPNGAEKIDNTNAQYGMNYRNLTAVEVLQKVVGSIVLNGSPDSPRLPTAPFLAGLYVAVLKRPIDTIGFGTFAAELNEGVSPEQVVQQIWTSPEHRQLQIEEYYRSYLHRDAEAEGMQYWLGQFGVSQNEFLIQVGFLNSAEFVGQHSTNAGVIEEIYQDVLKRKPGASEVASWENAQQQGATQSWVAGQIVLSAEAAGIVVDEYFVNDLGRHIDTVGLNAALALVGDGSGGYERVAEMILTSQEFINRFS